MIFVKKQAKYLIILCFVFFALIRLLTPDLFVMVDEPKWLERSANFYQAVYYQDFVATYQSEHPGVLTMWIGTAAYLWHYPEISANWQSGPVKIGEFLKEQGIEPIDVLATSRLVMVLFITIFTYIIYLLFKQILGRAIALFSIALLALDPFHIALSSWLHLDAPLGTCMFLSILSIYCYFLKKNINYLILSAIATGFAWLTKTPGLILIPFVGLLFLTEWIYILWWRRRKNSLIVTTFSSSGKFILWLFIALIVFIICWPAMWVEPMESIVKMFEHTLNYATQGHNHAAFFLGQIMEGDPGWRFYPIMLFWHLTPITTLGLCLFILIFIRTVFYAFINREYRDFSLKIGGQMLFSLFLLGYSIFYLASMTIGAQKSDRYVFPAFLATIFLAAIGYIWSVSWIVKLDIFSKHSSKTKFIEILFLSGLLLIQSITTGFSYPYFASQYNPLLIKALDAPSEIELGFGEGLNESAKFINDLSAMDRRGIAPSDLQVLSWYHEGSFSYYFPGTAEPIRFTSTDFRNTMKWAESDYLVTYINQWQRRKPYPGLFDYLVDLEPIHETTINDIQYARVYDIFSSPIPPFITEQRYHLAVWDNSIRLIYHTLPQSPITPDTRFHVDFYLQNIKPIENNLNVAVILRDISGQAIIRFDGWPWQSSTSEWKQGDIWPDGYDFHIPHNIEPGFYRIELGFYDPATQDWLSTSHTSMNRQPLNVHGEGFIVDFIEVRVQEMIAKENLHSGVSFEQKILLNQFTDTSEFDGFVDIELTWSTDKAIQETYTAFVQILDEQDRLIAQHDEPPLRGFFPTNYWKPRMQITTNYRLQLPSDISPGKYRVIVGWYDSETMERLSVTPSDKSQNAYNKLSVIDTNDAVVIRTLYVD